MAHFFGIDDNKNAVGLTDAQADTEAISCLIKEHVTPYYYKADGTMEVYVRMEMKAQ